MNEKALDNKCPSCGAPLLFKPKSNKWICDHCKSSFTLEELKKFNNASSDENNKKEEVIEEPKEVKKEVKDNTVYELKFVNELTHEHFLQCACYIIALNLKKGVLWNTRTNVNLFNFY